MLQISVTITGLREVQAKLASLGRSLTDMRRAMREIAEKLPSYFANEAFRSRGGVFQSRWPALSERYAKAKRKMWGSKPIMVASGSLSDSFYGEYNSHSATIGNRSPNFKYHQSNRRRRVIPRRQMIGVNSRVKFIVRTAVENDIHHKMRTA